MELHDLLVKTRNKIEGHWIQHHVWDNGHMCIIGGFYCAVGNLEPNMHIDGEQTREVIEFLYENILQRDQNTLDQLIRTVYREDSIGALDDPTSMYNIVRVNLDQANNVLEFLPFLNDELILSEQELLWLLDELIKRTAPEPEEIELTEPLAQKELVNA